MDLEYTVAEIGFKEWLKPFDPSNNKNVVYWTRILLKPLVLNHRVKARRLLTGLNWPQISVQPCEIACPAIVLGRLRATLGKDHGGKQSKSTSSAYRTLKDDWITNGFDCPSNVAWVEDHRMSVVLDDRCMLTSTQEVGAVSFFRVQEVGEHGRHAWNWNAGTEYYPNEDPFCVGGMTYDWLAGRAPDSDNAEHYWNIAHELGLPPPYVAFALTALNNAGYITKIKTSGGDRFYCGEKDDALAVESEPCRMRMLMAESQPPPRRGLDERRFPGRAYMVHFDLCWCWAPDP